MNFEHQTKVYYGEQIKQNEEGQKGERRVAYMGKEYSAKLP